MDGVRREAMAAMKQTEIRVERARHHNLRDVSCRVPLGRLCVVLAQDRVQPGRYQSVIDRTQAGRLLRVVLTHFVQLAFVVTDVGDTHGALRFFADLAPVAQCPQPRAVKSAYTLIQVR